MHEKLRAHMQVCILHYHLRYCAGCKIFRKIFLVYLFYSSSRPLLILLLYLQLMNEDLLQDLVLYKKSHEKAVSIAARSLITLFREVSSYPFAYSVISFCSLQLNLLLVWVQICPSLLVKKDGRRPADPKARPKAFGKQLSLLMCLELSCYMKTFHQKGKAQTMSLMLLILMMRKSCNLLVVLNKIWMVV